MRLFVHILPSLASPTDLQGRVAVMIDALRASTTITHALHAGCPHITPCIEVDHALAARDNLPPDQPPPLLGGERKGQKIPGFDLGNSPTDYTPTLVRNRPILFTTTNGTRALLAAAPASRVLIGCFNNRSALAHALHRDGRDAHLLCAGTDGHPGSDDLLAAGSIAAALLALPNVTPANDSAQLALELFNHTTTTHAAPNSSVSLIQALRRSRGGRNLIDLNLADDIDTCAQLDSLPTVGQWHHTTNRIITTR